MSEASRVIRIVHLSDLHCGVHCDLAQIARLEEQIPALGPTAIAITGDLTQRSRHGEYQRALAFVQGLEQTAPVHVIPGNHDVAWWTSPFGVRGRPPLYRKYRHYFGDLSPVLSLPGVVIVGALTSYGLSFGSMTWNQRDLAVKGHLPAGEVVRARAIFAEAPAGTLRVLAVHHNVLRGEISQRMGLARWRQAQRRLEASGADLILCGHDHQEGIGRIGPRLVVGTASTHSNRTRGKRPSVFNVVTVDATSLTVQQMRWDRDHGRFMPGLQERFARACRA